MASEGARNGEKTVVVTGANSGLGKSFVRCLRDDGYHVIMACRSLDRASAAIEELGPSDAGTLQSLQLDLANLSSVRSFCTSFGELGRPLDVLICNGGINSASSSGNPTNDGFDEVFATNYLGHFLLCSLLTPHLSLSGSSIVMVTSVMHRHAEDPRAVFTDDGIRGHKGLYGHSKLAQILHAKELQRRLPSTHIFTVNPGGVATDIWREYPWWQRWTMARLLASPDAVAKLVVDNLHMSPQATYYNTQRLAGRLPGNIAEYLGPTGAELVPTTPSPAACDNELARQLYADSELWVKLGDGH